MAAELATQVEYARQCCPMLAINLFLNKHSELINTEITR